MWSGPLVVKIFQTKYAKLVHLESKLVNLYQKRHRTSHRNLSNLFTRTLLVHSIQIRHHICWRIFEIFRCKARNLKLLKNCEKGYVAESGTPRRLRTDNGAEYTSKQFKDYRRDSKIKQEFIVPETPQQNGVAERFNRTLVEMGRSLLIQVQLWKRYWIRALSTAAHIRNLTMTANSSQGKSPFELFTGIPPEPSTSFRLYSICYEEKNQLGVGFEIDESQIYRIPCQKHSLHLARI